MNSLEDYGNLFLRLGLTELEVEDGEFTLRLKRESTVSDVRIAADKSSSVITDEIDDALKKSDEVAGEAIKAPLLGIFYSLKGDDKEIKVGDTVTKGDILCTIEAMKMMNEVRATKSGVIAQICANDGDLVEYNQDLFIVA